MKAAIIIYTVIKPENKDEQQNRWTRNRKILCTNCNKIDVFHLLSPPVAHSFPSFCYANGWKIYFTNQQFFRSLHWANRMTLKMGNKNCWEITKSNFHIWIVLVYVCVCVRKESVNHLSRKCGFVFLYEMNYLSKFELELIPRICDRISIFVCLLQNNHFRSVNRFSCFGSMFLLRTHKLILDIMQNCWRFQIVSFHFHTTRSDISTDGTHSHYGDDIFRPRVEIVCIFAILDCFHADIRKWPV